MRVRSSNYSPAPARAPEEKRKQLEDEALPFMDLIYAVARRMVGDDTRAEDLVQETYLRAFRAVDQYQLGSNCKAWLLTILRSVYTDTSRQVMTHGGAHAPLPAAVLAKPERSDLPIDAARLMSILDLILDDDIKAAMLALPEVYREAFVMVVIAGLTYKEAGQVLGVADGPVKSRVFRACQLLKSHLWHYATERRMTEAKGEAGVGAERPEQEATS